MPILLLSARHSEDSQKLWRACIATKWEVYRVNGWKVPEVPPSGVVVYGEPLVGHHIAQTLNLRLIEPPLDWLPRLPKRWRCRDVRLTTLAAARAIQDRTFVKPADEKCFDAKVYAAGADLPAPGALPEDLPVLVQEVVQWRVEYRCFVMDRTVATASVYWRHGALAQTADGTWAEDESELGEAIEFCQRVLADPEVSVPDAAVIDVGVIENRGWAVVECNAPWASGIYGCDPVDVLRVLRRGCQAK